MDEIAALVAAAGDSDEIRSRVHRLVHKMLDEIEWQIDNATPAAKQQLLRTAVPALMRVVQDGEQVDEELLAVRQELLSLHDEVRQGLFSIPADVVEVKAVPAKKVPAKKAPAKKAAAKKKASDAS